MTKTLHYKMPNDAKRMLIDSLASQLFGCVLQ